MRFKNNSLVIKLYLTNSGEGFITNTTLLQKFQHTKKFQQQNEHILLESFTPKQIQKKFEESQILKGPPRFLITSAILSRIDITNFSQYSGVVTLSHANKIFLTR